MLITLTNPIGIDWYVQKLQTYVHDQLLSKWAVQSSDYIAYGRCYRNKTDNGYVAEHYTGAGNYKEVYWDGSVSAVSFFGNGNVSRRGAMASVDVHLVFFVNTELIKPSIEHRADEEVRQDVSAILGTNKDGFQVAGIDFGIENVLREYPGSRRDERLKYIDMHPVHCFRINLKLNYDPNKIC
jgi:hypothetical protein